MEPGTLELQIFVSLIVILGTAFVALVCDYLKGNNESLREHNIELRVRKEEQDKHQPLEAVQWLQHLLGATQRNPIRFGSVRPAPRREAHPAARHTAHPAAAPAPARTPAAVHTHAAPVPQPAAVPTAQPAAEVKPSEVTAATAVAKAEATPERASRLHAGRARRQAEGANAPSLLETLPKPAWLQKEQEEKAAARALREKEVQAPPPPASVEPVIVKSEAEPVQAQTEPRRHDPFWTYRGLLDRVVAATSGPDRAEEPALKPVREQAVEKVEVVETVHLSQAPPVQTAFSGPVETISTVTIDVPAHPANEPSAKVEPETSEASASSQFLWTPSEPIAEVLEVVYEPQAAAEPDVLATSTDSELEDIRPAHSDPETITITPEPRPVPQLISMPSLPELRLPPGYHDRSVFARHMHSLDVLTGVVAAIGINDYAHHNEKMGIGPMADLMRSVENMIAGMLRANIDFGCRSNDDEFILVFPNETGADAQRRLTTISERLWNFQLRSLTSFSVFFSWGAVEVQGETLPDAAASASERMYQTKRNRKTLSVDGQRRKLAVNL